ncbi:hypothetical protein [Nocardia fluminea]|uniref:hypothetical protein n=1 Tax=Actinomycetes TaxID=1760 RepID=UPI00365DC2B5
MRTTISAHIDQPVTETEPVPYALVNGPAFAIQLANGRLYRDEHAHLQDPEGDQPTIWYAEDAAEIQRQLLEVLLELWYGIEPFAANLNVVRVERDADGEWRVHAQATAERGKRPLDPDTYEPAELTCTSTVDLTIDRARRVMRQHRACAGSMPCLTRGRARALLAREGVMRLNRKASAWRGLALPETA